MTGRDWLSLLAVLIIGGGGLLFAASLPRRPCERQAVTEVVAWGAQQSLVMTVTMELAIVPSKEAFVGNLICKRRSA
jgi:hypothetical protein